MSIFVAPRCRRSTLIPPSAISGVERVESIKTLGVTINRKFSVEQHVDHLLSACAQTLFVLRTLRHLGLPEDAIRAVFQAVVVAKLTYASPAWWGFSSSADRGQLDAFLRRAAALNYRRTDSAWSFSSLCEVSDERLFNSILNDSQHIQFHLLLPPVRDNHYYTRIIAVIITNFLCVLQRCQTIIVSL
jgi:hypothetical protein